MHGLNYPLSGVITVLFLVLVGKCVAHLSLGHFPFVWCDLHLPLSYIQATGSVVSARITWCNPYREVSIWVHVVGPSPGCTELVEVGGD